MIRFILQSIANTIINRMEALNGRTDKLANKEFAKLYRFGQELVTVSLMGFAMELD